MAVSRMTTRWLTWAGVGVGVVGAAAAVDGWWLGGAAAVAWPPGEVTAATTRYAPYPSSRASTTIIARLQLGPRRSFSLIGVAGSKTSAALIAWGAPCVVSYSWISGSEATPTTPAMLRMWPRA